MKLLLFHGLLAIVILNGCAQSTDINQLNNTAIHSNAQDWEQVIDDGFGSKQQTTIPEMEVYKGHLYVATSADGKAVANLWRSVSGDPDSWELVTQFDPDFEYNRSIHSFGVTDLDGGYIWLGTGNQREGAMIYRSQDGVSWQGISQPGFGNSKLTGAAPHMVVFQGPNDDMPYLYAAMGSHGGGTPGQVWRTPYTNTDSANWERLIDFSSIDPAVQTISYFYVWHNTLYFATDAGGQLWQSADGVHFEQNASVGQGFGDPTNYVISSLVDYDDYLYATTTNRFGGQLWRSPDGQDWQQITADAFGKGAAVNELRSLRTSFDQIWLTAYTNTELSFGTPVWNSSDGVNFTQLNTDGFGDLNNNGKNAVTIGFGDYQYLAGPNYVEGGQLWRLKITGQ